MGLFDKLKKGNRKDSETANRYDNDLLEIVRIVSFNDADILKHAQECIDHTVEYYGKHRADYEERGITDEEETSFLQWFGCINLLMNNNYVCECDWKEDKESFYMQLSALKGIRLLSLKIKSEWIDEEGSVPEWCEKLGNKWKKSKDVIAAFDINSDSYLMSVCKEEDMKKLMDLAENFGYRIDYAQNM